MLVARAPAREPAPDPPLAELIASDERRVFILDDDPTGTQTVSGVDVILRPDGPLFERFLGSPDRSVFVLTNSRALSVGDSVALLTRLKRDIEAMATAQGIRPAYLLRGDSTLRGHVFAEADVFGGSRHVVLFVPAFPEGGRITRRGVQWVRIDGRSQNAADTEYAADPVFGYRSRDLVSWVAETGKGRSAMVVPLRELRNGGPAVVSSALATAAPGTVVVPEATRREDLELVARGLLTAEAHGHQVVVRCAASFAAIRAGLEGRSVSHVPLRAPGRLLIVCGSTTRSSTEQLERLAAAGVFIQTVDGPPSQSLLESVAVRLDGDGVAVLATPRRRAADMQDLASGAKVMQSLCRAVAGLEGHFEGALAKGGATSGEVALALGAGTARVEGQLAPGVPLWMLRVADSMTMPYGVVPGNVGDSGTLLRVVRRFAQRVRGSNAPRFQV